MKEDLEERVANICTVGLWHQALVLAAGFADMGHSAHGVGDEPEVARALGEGHTPLFEPGLAALSRRNIKAGRLQFSSAYRQAAPLCG